MAKNHTLGEQYATQIEGQVDELIRIIAATSDEHWSRRAANGQWIAGEVCGHLIEMLPFWATKAQQAVELPGLAWGREEDDEGRLSGVTRGGALTRHDAVEQLRAASAAACRILRSLPDRVWHTEAATARGAETIDVLVHRALVEHLEGHVEQVRDAVGH